MAKDNAKARVGALRLHEYSADSSRVEVQVVLAAITSSNTIWHCAEGVVCVVSVSSKNASGASHT